MDGRRICRGERERTNGTDLVEWRAVLLGCAFEKASTGTGSKQQQLGSVS